MWPPDTSSATKGNCGARAESSGDSRCPFEVMDADRRDAEGERQRMREGSADQQRAGEAGTFRIAHPGQQLGALPRFFQHLAGQRHQAADMVAGGELRHHAAVGFVHGDLGMHRVGEQAPGLSVVHGDAGLVAGRLYPEEQPFMLILIQFSPFRSAAG